VVAAHDEAIAAILSAIRELMGAPPPKRRPIGFTADLEEKSSLSGSGCQPTGER